MKSVSYSHKQHKRYASFLVAVPLIALAGIALLNYTVDPYRLFSANPTDLYIDYPALHPNLRLHKAYQINLQKPDTIILGTSKAIQGIPLDHAYFEGKSVYNLAAPLASMRELYHLLLHADANQTLKEVVLVIDFLSFNVLARVDGPAAGYVESRLKTPTSNGTYWPDYLAATLSADALSASLDVLSPASNPTYRVLNGRGGRESDEIVSRLSDGGHRTNSQKIEAFFVDSVLLAPPYRRFSMHEAHDDSLMWFEKFVAYVQQNDIHTTVLIGPSHSRYWELLYQAGLWPLYEQWKAQLVQINNRLAHELETAPLALWDFSLPNVISSEPFPVAGDSDSRMQYYFEAVHFNQHTGGLVLDRISEKHSEQLPASFGVLLTDTSLPGINRQLRQGLESLRSRSPEMIGELQEALPTR